MKQRLTKNIELLLENLYKLNKSILRLNFSYQNIEKINFSQLELSDTELELMESLCSRFARSSDILVQKVLKSFFILIQEDFTTFLDIAELAEKFEIIQSSSKLILIRDLRNQISHEYEESEIYNIFKEVIAIIPEFQEIIQKTNSVITTQIKRFN